MSTMEIGGGAVYSTEHGQVLDGNAMRFAQIINDYDSKFHLEFVPERDRAGESPYRVINRSPDGSAYVVRHVSHQEMQEPHKVLAAIWSGDLRFHSADSILSELELQETAARLLKLKEREEAYAEAEERMVFGLTGGRDGKHYIREGGKTIAR